MSIHGQRFVNSLPGATIATVLGAGGMLSALLTDLPMWQRLMGFGVFLGIAVAGAGMVLGQLQPDRLGWCKRFSMPLGLTVIGCTLLGGGLLIAITGEGAEGADPTLVGVVSAGFGLVLTVLGIAALFATTRTQPEPR